MVSYNSLQLDFLLWRMLTVCVAPCLYVLLQDGSLLCSSFCMPHHLNSLTFHQQIIKGENGSPVPHLINLIDFLLSIFVCLFLSLFFTFVERHNGFRILKHCTSTVTVLSPVLFSNQISTKGYFKTESPT